MKKILFALFLLPSISFADRLGGLNPNSQIALSSQTLTSTTTNFILNTLSPTTTTQQFSVMTSVVTDTSTFSTAFSSNTKSGLYSMALYPGRNYPVNDQGAGGIYLDNTQNSGIGMNIYSNQASAAGLGVLLRIHADNLAYAQPAVHIINDGTSGAAANIRMDGPAPQIEFVELDQAAPAGKYEMGVNGDILYFAGRNAADNAFTDLFRITRIDAAGGGYVATLATTPVRFYDLDNSNYVAFKATGNVTANVTWVLPPNDSSGCWKSDGAGNLYFGPCVSTTAFIQNTNNLQSGSTFYVSSGTVAGSFYLNGIGNGGFGSANSVLTFFPSANSFDGGGSISQFQPGQNQGFIFRNYGPDQTTYRYFSVANDYALNMKVGDQLRPYFQQGSGYTVFDSSYSGVGGYLNPPNDAVVTIREQDDDIYSYLAIEKTHGTEGVGGTVTKVVDIDTSSAKFYTPLQSYSSATFGAPFYVNNTSADNKQRLFFNGGFMGIGEAAVTAAGQGLLFGYDGSALFQGDGGFFAGEKSDGTITWEIDNVDGYTLLGGSMFTLYPGNNSLTITATNYFTQPGFGPLQASSPDGKIVANKISLSTAVIGNLSAANLPSLSTITILNQNTLQNGASFYTQSGNVNGLLTVATFTVLSSMTTGGYVSVGTTTVLSTMTVLGTVTLFNPGDTKIGLTIQQSSGSSVNSTAWLDSAGSTMAYVSNGGQFATHFGSATVNTQAPSSVNTVGQVFNYFRSSATIVSAAEQTLYVSSISANSLNTPGDTLYMVYVSTILNSGSGKTVKINFGNGVSGGVNNPTIYNAGSLAPSLLSTTTINMRLTYVTATTGRLMGTLIGTNGPGTLVIARNVTGLDFTKGNLLSFTCTTAGAAGEFTAFGGYVQYLPADNRNSFR